MQFFNCFAVAHCSPTPTLLHSVQSIKLENPTKKCRNLMKKFRRALLGALSSSSKCQSGLWNVFLAWQAMQYMCGLSTFFKSYLLVAYSGWNLEIRLLKLFLNHTSIQFLPLCHSVLVLCQIRFFYSINKFWFSHLGAIAHKPQMVMVLGCNFIVC